MNFYDLKAKTIGGKEKSFEDYKGKTLIIVNTASKCGLTPQFDGLEKIYKEFKGQGLEILGFPSNQFAEQEPGNADDIQEFCKLNYGVTFQLFEKSDVRDENANEVFKYLTDNAEYKGFNLENPQAKMLSEFLGKNFPKYLEGNGIKWNFTKFLIDKNGNIVERFEPAVNPEEMIDRIKEII